MFDWLKPKTVYRIVELPPIGRLSANKTDKEIAESVLTLQAHPGFLYLLQRLDAYNAALKSKLVGERHDDIKAVQFLQAGIYWSNWLRQELSTQTRKLQQRSTAPYEEELEEFKKLDAMIERVGE